MTFEKKAKLLRSIPAADQIPGHLDDLIFLGRFRNTLAHGRLVYVPRTGQLKIWNRRTSEETIVSKASRAEIDEKVIRVDDFLNSLLAEQKAD